MARIGAPLSYESLLAAILVGASVTPVWAGQACHREQVAAGVSQYGSQHLRLNTDLAAPSARALLTRLEATLRAVSRYWGRPPARRIQCYVVDDLDRWTADELPSRFARVVLQRVGGAIDVRPIHRGHHACYEAVLYATTQPGVAEHELVHAYCIQTFGRTGPEWYREGMAEIVTFRRGNQPAVRCPPELLRALHGAARGKTISEIIHGGRFTAPVSELILRMDEGRSGQRLKRLRAWRAADDQTVLRARESYYWAWALCYFLSNNPNYSARFQALGRGYLTGQDVRFDQVFGAVSDEMTFEFRQFIQNVENGYRVDLCHWDWTKQCSKIDCGHARSARVSAARGYQSTGLLVSAAEKYDFSTTGTWKTGKQRAAVTANGDQHRRGRLVGVVVHGGQLGEPFDLGARGSFVVPRAGRLYLRCRDNWNELSDNRGVVTVRFQRLRQDGASL